MGVDHPDRPSVRALVERRAAEAPQAVYAIAPDTGQQLTFARLLSSARGLAGMLARRGVAPGDRVALLLPNGLQALRLFIGIMAAGHVATPLSLLAQPDQLAYVLEHSDCRLVFAGPEQATMLRDSAARQVRQIAVVIVDPDADWIAGEAVHDEHGAWPGPAQESTDSALLMYTSGTTGLPKGVLLSHGNVCAGARFVSEAHALDAADRVLAVLPLYHINAQIVTALAPLHHGGSVVLPRRFSAASFWSLAAEHRCTWLNVVPTIIAYLLQGADPRTAGLDLSLLRFCRCASAPLAPEHHQAFESRFAIGIVETMGLTETAAPVFSNPLDPARRKIGSPGQAFGNQARVVETVQGLPLCNGVAGEIQVRGPNVMIGYHKAPQDTALAFTADGWLRTGDLGYRDTAGFYFITGRLKEIIIKGGENIAPREIDEVLLRHPAVLEAAAFGVPDSNYGQDIEAAVAPKSGSTINVPELLDFCLRELGRFKMPRAIHVLSDLPKGPSGKVQRLKLLQTIRPGA